MRIVKRKGFSSIIHLVPRFEVVHLGALPGRTPVSVDIRQFVGEVAAEVLSQKLDLRVKLGSVIQAGAFLLKNQNLEVWKLSFMTEV